MSVSVGNAAASAANAKMIAETIQKGNQINSVALKQFSKESNVETKDMKQANSIFDAAKKIVEKSKTKGTNAQQKIEGKLDKKKKEAMGIINNKISPSNKLIEAYEEQRAELLKQKEELENKIKDLGGEVNPNGETDQNVLNTAPTEKSKAKGAKNGPSKSKNSTSANASSELTQLQAQLQTVRKDLGNVTASLENEVETITGYMKEESECESDLGQIENEGESELDGIQDQMQSEVDNKSATLQPIADKQAKSSQSNSAVGKKAGDFAQNNVTQALNKAEDNSQKQALNTLKKNLNSRKESLGSSNTEGLAGKNYDNATVKIPKYSSDINDAVMSAIQNDFTGMNTSIMSAYQTALSDLSSALSSATASSSGSQQSSKVSVDASSDTGVDVKNIMGKGGNAAMAIANGEDVGSVAIGIAASAGQEILNSVAPGLGDALGMVGDVFGLF